MIAATEIFSLNEQGKRRNNEDRIYPPKGVATIKENLFIVCDGVGGENQGEVASEIVCTSIYHYIKSQDFPLSNGKEAIEKAITYANRKLAEHAAGDSAAKRMSTTLSLILLNEQSIIAAWCGDTRIHQVREGRVIWKSDDHSLVHELVKTGEISEKEARSHPQKNVITRSLNALNTNNTVEFKEITDYRNGDYFLLCTDGFLEQVNDDVIFSVLYNGTENNKANQFFGVCEGNTNDNFSMYLVKVKDTGTKSPKDSSSSHLLFTSLIVIICLVTIVIMFVMLRKNEVVGQRSLDQKGITNQK